MINIPVNARWSHNGVTVAGGNGGGDAVNQLARPHGLCVDDGQMVIVADRFNHRAIQWTKDNPNGQVVAGGNEDGDRLDQLSNPTDVIIDQETNSFLVCDQWNERIVRWSRRKGTKKGEILVDKIQCWGLAIDNERNIYVSDHLDNKVRRYRIGDKKETIVAGGNGEGTALNQFHEPTYLCVDQHGSIYVSDYWNHRVMKWIKGATEGIVVAGWQGEGNSLTQLFHPGGLFVDSLDNIYIADSGNNRILRVPPGAKQGTVIVGGNGRGSSANQLDFPIGLSFDSHANLYVVDNENTRVQRFSRE